MKNLLWLILLFSSRVVAEPLPKVYPKDKFSKSFLKIFYDAGNDFDNVKGGKLKTGGSGFNCRVSLPGYRKGKVIDSAGRRYSIFISPDFASYNDAEFALIKYTGNVRVAMGERTRVKRNDTSSIPGVIKKNQLAYIKSDGFYHYNVAVELKADSNKAKPYNILTEITGGEPLFYKFISKNEPIISPEFLDCYRKIMSKLEYHNYNVCGDYLPGFHCSDVDSAGKTAVLMEKETGSKLDAQMEFEATVTNIKGASGNNYLYYLPPVTGKDIKKAVFIKGTEFEKDNRKSTAVTLQSTPEGFYKIIIQLYQP